MEGQMKVFVTGGTGFIGRALIPALAARGNEVRALVRPGSEARLPVGAIPVVGDPLHGASFVTAVGPVDALVHLVGVSRPSPAKARQFREVDLVSALESLRV